MQNIFPLGVTSLGFFRSIGATDTVGRMTKCAFTQGSSIQAPGKHKTPEILLNWKPTGACP
jgi:hypothetical protein